MNKMLERALAEIEKLPEDEQEAIACVIMDEIDAEKGWEERFARSQDRLADLARRAGDRIAEGKTAPFDPSDRRRR
ncbi:MAG: hypothetical protein KGO48_08500 [Alphaproteobacteria bacterium]|nr:hypothetical protein [Alphaproteobacteria bacterium]